MKITNVTGLPDSLVRLVSGERVLAPNEVSVTTLIKPAQLAGLERIHYDDLVEDAADRIWATYGSLVHLALEKMGHDNALVEEQLRTQIGGWEVVGTPDLYQDATLTDFKFVSVWTTKDGIKREWATQLNFYAHLLREHGFEVNALQVVTLYRDWSKTRAKEHDYPQQQVARWPVPIWGDHATEYLMVEAVRRYDAAMQGIYPPCTEEERWHRPDEYAVTKKGNKRASRLLPTYEEAAQWATDNTPRPRKPMDWYEITKRPGLDARCESYCRVSEYCKQWAANRE